MDLHNTNCNTKNLVSFLSKKSKDESFVPYHYMCDWEELSFVTPNI